jgi:type IV fimbrial biogenesis protein FimT
MAASRTHSGISWVELLCAVGLLALLTAVGMPSFRDARANAATLSAANALIAAAHLARSQALLLGQATVLCLSNDGERCVESRGAARGWIAFVDRRRSRIVQRDAAEPLLARSDLRGGVTLRGTRAAITYWPTPEAGTTATITVCPNAPNTAARALIVSQTGRPRLTRLGSDPDACRVMSVEPPGAAVRRL